MLVLCIDYTPFLLYVQRQAHSGTFHTSNDIGHLCDFAMIYGIKEPISGWSMNYICTEISMLL